MNCAEYYIHSVNELREFELMLVEIQRSAKGPFELIEERVNGASPRGIVGLML